MGLALHAQAFLPVKFREYLPSTASVESVAVY